MAIDTIAPFTHIDSFQPLPPPQRPEIEQDNRHKESFSETLKSRPTPTAEKPPITSTVDLAKHLEDSSLRVKSDVIRSRQQSLSPFSPSRQIPGSELLATTERQEIKPHVAQFRRQKIAKAYQISTKRSFQSHNFIWG